MSLSSMDIKKHWLEYLDEDYDEARVRRRDSGETFDQIFASVLTSDNRRRNSRIRKIGKDLVGFTSRLVGMDEYYKLKLLEDEDSYVFFRKPKEDFLLERSWWKKYYYDYDDREEILVSTRERGSFSGDTYNYLYLGGFGPLSMNYYCGEICVEYKSSTVGKRMVGLLEDAIENHALAVFLVEDQVVLVDARDFPLDQVKRIRRAFCDTTVRVLEGVRSDSFSDGAKVFGYVLQGVTSVRNGSARVFSTDGEHVLSDEGVTRSDSFKRSSRIVKTLDKEVDTGGRQKIHVSETVLMLEPDPFLKPEESGTTKTARGGRKTVESSGDDIQVRFSKVTTEDGRSRKYVYAVDSESKKDWSKGFRAQALKKASLFQHDAALKKL